MMTRGTTSLTRTRAAAARGWTAVATSTPRRRWQAGSAIALLLAGATALSTREFGSGANAASSAATGGAASPAALLAQRSPGNREPGALAQSKPYYALAPSDLVPGFVPRERVLSNERVRSPVGPASPGPAANVAPEPLAALGVPGPLAALGTPGGATGPGVFPGVPGGGGPGFGGGAPGGGGGGGGGGVAPPDDTGTTPPGGDTGTTPPGTTPPGGDTGTTPPGTTPPGGDTGTTPPGTTPPGGDTGTTPPDNPGVPGTPPPTGAIPEPSTWAMLILGLFATAGMMRRRRVRPAPGAATGASVAR